MTVKCHIGGDGNYFDDDDVDPHPHPQDVGQFLFWAALAFLISLVGGLKRNTKQFSIVQFSDIFENLPTMIHFTILNN